MAASRMIRRSRATPSCCSPNAGARSPSGSRTSGTVSGGARTRRRPHPAAPAPGNGHTQWHKWRNSGCRPPTGPNRLRQRGNSLIGVFPASDTLSINDAKPSNAAHDHEEIFPDVNNSSYTHTKLTSKNKSSRSCYPVVTYFGLCHEISGRGAPDGGGRRRWPTGRPTEAPDGGGRQGWPTGWPTGVADGGGRRGWPTGVAGCGVWLGQQRGEEVALVFDSGEDVGGGEDQVLGLTARGDLLPGDGG
jgi:hypothetical protein